MNSSELRDKFLKFFESKGHKIIPSASLIPENDPTVLFTTAGMHPLVPYLLGQKHPEGKRLTSCQKCIRTGDIDDVGDDTHLTFFEMLGNWSLGDYWKKEAIEMSFEFLTSEKYLGIDKNKLAISVFAGDDDAPFDKEAFEIWKNLGISEKRIAKLGKKDNWWGPAGKTGPCGPDTEMFYWKNNNEKAPEVFDPENKNWVEIWNDVFMQYVKTEDGKFVEAEQKNVDTGMGLERTLAVLNNAENVYHTDLFEKSHKKLHELLEQEDPVSERIILDHLRATTFLLAEKIAPSNLGQGYIVRRLIRRAIRYGKKIGIKKNNWIKEIAEIFVQEYKNIYSELEKNKNFIFTELEKEEEKFEATLKRGGVELEKIEGELENIIEWFNNQDQAEFVEVGKPLKRSYPEKTAKELGKKLFDLYQRHSISLEESLDVFKKWNVPVIFVDDVKNSFDDEFKKHQELSRTASAGMFKGGLADASEQVTKYHTATHLLLAGLRKILGENVFQKGSNITAERMRFDFSYPEKMTKDQIQETENFVNDIIKKDLPVYFEEMNLAEAKKINAMGVFESKYGEKVKVYFIGKGSENVSKEICGGPHVERTGVLGHFKIQKEESSSAGIRRIKAILENN